MALLNGNGPATHPVEIVHASTSRKIDNKMRRALLVHLVSQYPRKLEELLRRFAIDKIILQVGRYPPLFSGSLGCASLLCCDFDDDSGGVPQADANQL